VTFTNLLSDASAARNQILLNGSGVALGDVDGDGWCDLFFCGLDNANALYRNRGDWRFEDVTASAGVGCAGVFSMGAALADMDGDRDLDLLVTVLGGGVRLFLNDGRGRFTEVRESGLVAKGGAKTLALADVDGEGDVDLYVANNRTTTVRDTGLKLFNVAGRRVVRPEERDQIEILPDGRFLEYGEPDVLYLNEGGGRFVVVPWTGGGFLDEAGRPLAAPPRDWGLAAMFRDLNRDGAPDLYVCNDFFTPDRLWLNDGRGGFRLAPEGMLRTISLASMAVDFADLNRDGLDDFMVVDMMARDHGTWMRQREPAGPAPELGQPGERRLQVQRNTLFLNRGDGTFAELAQLAGVEASGWSWGLAFLDVDLDGWEDALVVAGHARDTLDGDSARRLQQLPPAEAARQPMLIYPPHPAPKFAFRNRGDLTFADASVDWGFAEPGVSHGMALADLDQDGDLDVVVSNQDGPAGLYRNDASGPRLAVRLRGRGGNTQGIGARLTVTGAGLPQSQEMMAGGRYGSSDEPLRTFAGGALSNRLTVEVAWRSGRRSRLADLRPNCLYEIEEPDTPALPPVTPAAAGAAPPWFADVTAALGHGHVEAAFDDLARQPLLPHRLDRQGPGVAWCDLDGDGREDLLVGTGRGGQLGVFLNRGRGGLGRARLGPASAEAPEDQVAVLGWGAGEGTNLVLVAQSRYEEDRAGAPAARLFSVRSGRVELAQELPGWDASPGPAAVGDVDGDGRLELFLGGRVVPGRWPEPAASRLHRLVEGRFEVMQEWPGLGLVSGAVLADLTGDGLPELALACEWGSLRVFRNERGRLAGQDLWPGLAGQTGWWNGVAAGDFDGDGRLDLLASNWGRNTAGERFRAQPLRLYYGDWRGNGAVDVLEARFEGGLGKIVPSRPLDVVGAALPFVAERHPSFRSYAAASVADVLGDRPRQERQAAVLETTVFLNRGDRFEARPLPVEAQHSVAFAVAVADFDGDGAEDVFLGQNFFAVPLEASRQDAGRGLWLRGDGRGGFRAVPGLESGLRIDGEQRGAAVADYDEDGRVDLVVTQNAGPTRLFRNERGRPGLRVRLQGPPGNPRGLGAVVRPVRGGMPGPARAVLAGSGYASQDSAVVVLAGGPERVEVRWPGGLHATVDIPPGAAEVAIAMDGRVQRLR
jgi:hypothetical protein